ncbi:MAG: alpha/beta fold hydrolase [Solirubrobacterales bacterium]|nr:alpha/beta fold hydrolase [Solirubrobacterales bacterium]
MDELPLRVAHTGEGAPLLLINGLGAALEMWDPLVRRLIGRHVIAFDLPGVGLSGIPQRPMRMPELARLVDRLLGRLRQERVDVLGYSLGGLLAQELAYRAPQRVRRLVLGATMPGVPSIPPNPLVGLMLLTPARYYDKRLAELIVPRIAGGRTARDRKVLRAGLNPRLARPPTTLGYLHQLYSVIGWSSHRWLHRLRHPTLVLHGDDDPVAPLVNARYLAWAIPGARIHVVRGGGHLFLFDQPGSAVGVLEDFLGEASSPAATSEPVR